MLIVGVDNVRSKQMQEIRLGLRGRAEIIMGKNTMMRRCIKNMAESRPDLQDLLPHIVGNIGFVFTEADLKDIKVELTENKVQASAKAGVIAPTAVVLDKGPTGCGPEKTTFFQALNLPTTIVKGSIELQSSIEIIAEGSVVGLSEARLLNMLNISPFFYGIVVRQIVSDGSIFPPAVLDISDDLLIGKFLAAACNVAAVCFEVGYVCKASVGHSIVNGFKNVLAVGMGIDYTFDHLERIEAAIANAPAAPAASADAAPAAAAAAPEPESESDDGDMDMGLFD